MICILTKNIFSICDVLDCYLQTLSLTSDVATIEDDDDKMKYDPLGQDQSPHLLETVQLT